MVRHQQPKKTINICISIKSRRVHQRHPPISSYVIESVWTLCYKTIQGEVVCVMILKKRAGVPEMCMKPLRGSKGIVGPNPMTAGVGILAERRPEIARFTPLLGIPWRLHDPKGMKTKLSVDGVHFSSDGSFMLPWENQMWYPHMHRSRHGWESHGAYSKSGELLQKVCVLGTHLAVLRSQRVRDQQLGVQTKQSFWVEKKHGRLLRISGSQAQGALYKAESAKERPERERPPKVPFLSLRRAQGTPINEPRSSIPCDMHVTCRKGKWPHQEE